MPSKRNWNSNRIDRRAQDILAAIARIREYIRGVSSAQFLRNNLVYDAVTRQILIISEACSRIREIEAKLDLEAVALLAVRQPGVPWHAIAGIGNIIRHAYGDDDPTIIRDAVFGKDLASLECALLAEFTSVSRE
ncbi:MAG: DUF86 domain-containing protein [Candidatus Eremiobacteraeota bacterium]|nr:DUF86 domain-containing protein [Candidatus Eremiobacteraeota bacterium]